jgi:hypothetical protein
LILSAESLDLHVARYVSVVLCGILSVVVLNTCLQIEVWHFLAGGNMLPNREGGKLRYSPFEREEIWRSARSNETEDASLKEGRPLTSEERSIFEKDKEHARRWNKVMEWTGGMGVLQYLLLPVALFWSALLTSRGTVKVERAVAWVCVFTNVISFISLGYRGYFND